MEEGFTKGSSDNLPLIDASMVVDFLLTSENYSSAEYRNIKMAMSSRASYGDDAIGYVQLKRESNKCTIKCKMCPEHKVHSKQYRCTIVVDEENKIIDTIECHDCVASQGGCKHALAFLLWVHRHSDKPSSTSVECYWRKSKLSSIGSTIKEKPIKDLSKKKVSSFPENRNVFEKYLETAKKLKLDSELLKYECGEQIEVNKVALDYLVSYLKEKEVDEFLKKVEIRLDIIKEVEEKTRDQYKNPLWFRQRYGRITASKAYDVSRCKKIDGILVSNIMGGKIPDTTEMERGRNLEEAVRIVVEKKLKTKINKCGIMLSAEYPMIAASPDGVFEDGIIEIKCPSNDKTFTNYIKDGKATQKYICQMQMQMFLSGKKKCFYCVADPKFEENENVTILEIDYDEELLSNLLDNICNFWKTNIYPLLFNSA